MLIFEISIDSSDIFFVSNSLLNYTNVIQIPNLELKELPPVALASLFTFRTVGQFVVIFTIFLLLGSCMKKLYNLHKKLFFVIIFSFSKSRLFLY